METIKSGDLVTVSVTQPYSVVEVVDRTRYVKGFTGRTVQVVVEDEKTLAGWTSEYVWCQIGADKAKVLTRDRGGTERRIRHRDLVDVFVRAVDGHVLTGDPA